MQISPIIGTSLPSPPCTLPLPSLPRIHIGLDKNAISHFSGRKKKVSLVLLYIRRRCLSRSSCRGASSLPSCNNTNLQQSIREILPSRSFPPIIATNGEAGRENSKWGVSEDLIGIPYGKKWVKIFFLTFKNFFQKIFFGKFKIFDL